MIKKAKLLMIIIILFLKYQILYKIKINMIKHIIKVLISQDHQKIL